MVKKGGVDLSEYELQRQANIAERDALLKQLALDAAGAGLGPKPVVKKPASNGTRTHRKAPLAKRIKQEVVPARKSSRLAGFTADSEVVKRKAEDDYTTAKEQERAKKQRVSGDLSLSDVVVSGKEWDKSQKFIVDIINRGANPYKRTFGEAEVQKTSDKELKAIREKMSGLELYDGWEPNQIKIVPERIYSMSFHPTPDKPLLFAGDKLGNLGIFDASQKPPKLEMSNDDDNEDEPRIPPPSITSFHLHTRTISAFQFSPVNPSYCYTSSYDSSIRLLDLAKSTSTEVYAPPSAMDDEPLSGIEIDPQSPHVLYFSRLDGYVGRIDTRASPKKADIFQLSEKKIGGFSLHPRAPHILATASLDRYMRIWDTRKTEGKGDAAHFGLVGEHLSALSVSHAAFNSVGQVATASYDDTIKIHSFARTPLASLAPDTKTKGNSLEHPRLTEQDMEPHSIRHNNQTGRWVTILRPQWQVAPETQPQTQRFVIGNMNRFVDVYAGSGEQLAQLGGDGVTAVPAVAVFHESKDWIAGGTASGKLCLWK
ncbi:hypothetical protein MMC25_002371 [Agyrium rufum]|nr:hypothetical protein [Agyrium rufum]